MKCLDEERYNFRKIRRLRDEKFEDFISRLFQQAKKCFFEDLQSQLKDQIIEKCGNNALRKEVFKHNITLEELVVFGRNFEAPKKSLMYLESTAKINQTATNAIDTPKRNQKIRSQDRTHSKDEKKTPKYLKSKRQANIVSEFEHKTYKIPKKIVGISTDSDTVLPQVSTEKPKKV